LIDTKLQSKVGSKMCHQGDKRIIKQKVCSYYYGRIVWSHHFHSLMEEVRIELI
jgi:hypothetical protein